MTSRIQESKRKAVWLLYYLTHSEWQAISSAFAILSSVTRRKLKIKYSLKKQSVKPLAKWNFRIL